MANRYDILAPRTKQDGGTFWHRVGTAFAGRDGGMNLIFDSLPLPDKEGRVSCIVREAKDLRAASGTGQRPANPNEPSDSIPF